MTEQSKITSLTPAGATSAAIVAPTRRFVRLHPSDNVVVAVVSLPTGTELSGEGVSVLRAVPMGHKVATRPIPKGTAVVKFGQIIGYATDDIAAGAHVHVHNCAMGEHDQNYQIGVDYKPVRYRDPMGATFKGLVRGDGRVGTRNFIALCSTVNCSATVVRHIADRVNNSGMLAAYPHIDGVIALSHGTGCGMDASGEGFEALERVLWGHATHPNVTAAIFIGLGCEVMQIARLKHEYGVGEDLPHPDDPGNGRHAQDDRDGARDDRGDAADASTSARDVPACDLMLALQCGGSDGYSGITANPALGVAADILVENGGTAILSETPEIYGAEHLLTRRADIAGSRREAGREHPLVGGLYRPQQHGDEQQPVARQQARRADDHPRKVARRGRQGRLDAR